MREANWNNRLSSLIANFITILALLLSAVGLYALISHAVAQLTPEIGVRVALGAKPRQVAWAVFRRALTPLAMGVDEGEMATAAPDDRVSFLAMTRYFTLHRVLERLATQFDATLPGGRSARRSQVFAHVEKLLAKAEARVIALFGSVDPSADDGLQVIDLNFLEETVCR